MAEPETRTAEPNPERSSTTGRCVGADRGGDATLPLSDRPTPEPASAERPLVTERLYPDEPPPSQGLPVLPGYQLLEVIGRGGMGTVFKAIHRELNRVVALKLIHPVGRDEASVRARFEREVRSLARIEHPNIVPVYDAGYWQGFPFLAMKYVAGGNLAHHLGRIRADLQSAVRLVAQVARAVHQLHAEGVLHRDLKPMNILLGEGDNPLVADFGLARWLDDDSDLTVTGNPLGTRQYMAPEQTLGRKSDYAPTCDIWGLGVVLYELMTGRRPFTHEDPVELYRRIRHEPPPACPDADPVLEAIVRKCLAKQPDDRYPTAEAVAADLDRWLAGEPVTAPAVPRVRSRAWRWVAVAAGVVILIAGLAGALYRWRPQESETSAPRTIAERLRAGETVELIGTKGLPWVDPVPVPDCDSHLSTSREGCCTLTSNGAGAVELVSEPLPLPVRLETEVAVVSGEVNLSWAGVYVGRKDTPAGNGIHKTLFLFTVRRATDPSVGDEVPRLERGTATSNWWVRSPPGVIDRFGDLQQPLPLPAPNDSLRWHVITVLIEPQILSGTWNGRAFDLIREVDVLSLFNTRAPKRHPNTGLTFGSPMFGPGIGLIVHNADGVFRNTRLVPVKR
jgi:predicted Ser/Thr protein kinase